MFQVNNKDTSSRLTIKAGSSGVFVVNFENFEHISNLVLIGCSHKYQFWLVFRHLGALYENRN